MPDGIMIPMRRPALKTKNGSVCFLIFVPVLIKMEETTQDPEASHV